MKKTLNCWSQKTCQIKKKAAGVCVTHPLKDCPYRVSPGLVLGYSVNQRTEKNISFLPIHGYPIF